MAMSGMAQTPIAFPESLSGTNFSLTIHPDSVQFLPGKKTFTNAFNNYSYLGPTLFLNKGDMVTMNVHNLLNDTSTVHWHGLHVPAADDGGPHTIILPGETWTPDFKIMNNASMYWYHPHTHMKTGQQAMRGAAGMIIVRDSAEATLNLPRHYGVDDFPIVIQSQQFDHNNQVLWRGMHDSILLVNGTIHPKLDVPAQVIRFRLLNASQERNFNFGFSGNQHFYVIGNDGGLLNHPVNVTRIRLSPGERAEILVDMSGLYGHTLHLMSYASEFPAGVQGGVPMMGMDTAMYSPINGIDFNILQLDIVSHTANAVFTIPSALVTVTRLLPEMANETREISITADNMMSMDGPFYFNGKLFDMERIDYRIPLNNIEIWTLFNQTMVAHPFHMHDIQFFVLDRDGVAVNPEEQGFKDVVMVAPQETVRFITKFEDFADSTMPYMYHCHILMHEDDGMMGQFVVVPSQATAISKFNLAQNRLQLFPNPAKDILHFDLNSIGNAQQFTYRILSNSGSEIRSSKSLKQNSIDISGIKTGYYVLLLDTGNKLYQGRFVKY